MEDIRKGRVLILGDGNFSFTGAFCRRMQRLREDKEVSASVVSSVREARTQLLERYPECGEHIQWLEGRGITLFFGLDATTLDGLQDSEDRRLRFDHIIFNFPHVGGKTNLRKSRQLLSGVYTACSNVLTEDGRFYLTLASGQSGLNRIAKELEEEGTSLPAHSMDSWQPLHLAAYGQLVAVDRRPFAASEWFSFGYRCAGYKNSSRHFHVENSETLVFRRAVDAATPSTLDRLQPESISDALHELRPFYIHDIAFWITDSFKTDAFVDAVHRLTKGLVKRITPLPQYSCCEQGASGEETVQRVSLCFRLIWQSVDYSLTREAARDLQLVLRERLPLELSSKYGMDIIVR